MPNCLRRLILSQSIDLQLRIGNQRRGDLAVNLSRRSVRKKGPWKTQVMDAGVSQNWVKVRILKMRHRWLFLDLKVRLIIIMILLTKAAPGRAMNL